MRINKSTVHNPAQLMRLLEAFDAEIDTIRTLVNDIRSHLIGDYLISNPGLAIGSTPANVANVAFDFIINGVRYSKAAVAAGTAPGNDVIPQNKYGACAFDIGADGTIDAVEAAANATGYASAALAIAGVPAVAADHARMGYVTVIKTDGAFTFGTTALNDASTTAAYTTQSSLYALAGVASAAVTEHVESGT